MFRILICHSLFIYIMRTYLTVRLSSFRLLSIRLSVNLRIRYLCFVGVCVFYSCTKGYILSCETGFSGGWSMDNVEKLYHYRILLSFPYTTCLIVAILFFLECITINAEITDWDLPFDKLCTVKPLNSAHGTLKKLPLLRGSCYWEVGRGKCSIFEASFPNFCHKSFFITH